MTFDLVVTFMRGAKQKEMFEIQIWEEEQVTCH